MDIQRLILFVVFSFSALLLWDAWMKHQQPPAVSTPAAVTPAGVPGRTAPAPVPAAPAAGAPAAGAPAAGILGTGQRVTVQTDVMRAVVDTQGGDLRRLELLKYEAADGESGPFLLFDDKPQRLYVAQSGLIGEGLPTHRDAYTVPQTRYALAPGQAHLDVTLTWQGNGFRVNKIYRFTRGSYVVDVRFEVFNGAGQPVRPDAYFQILRNDAPAPGEARFVHTYVGGAFFTEQGKFQKVPFDDIRDNDAEFVRSANDGWAAMLQHYFLSAWLPPKNTPREFYAKPVGEGLYSLGVILPVGVVQPGGTATLGSRLYAGPQDQERLEALAPGLQLTVDYGLLTVIAAPLFWVLSAIYKFVGNWGVAIILLTVLIKALFYPLSAKSYRSMAQMKVLGPKLQRLKEQYGDDRQKLHQAMMEIYKTEKINPLGGCLPIVVQIPVFIALYWVLLYSVELRNAPFFGWIHDLAQPDPYYVLPVIMGATMFLQTKLNPTPPDPIQAKVMTFMPIAFSVFFFFFPAGLVLYWLVNNILSITQQWLINRSTTGNAVSPARR